MCVATMRDALAVWRKELIDALRDRRTLLMVLVSSVLLGPAVLVAVSSLVATLESTAERREVVVAGIDAAPSLRNFLERQTYRVRAAPANYETQLRRSTLADPVVVVPADFEAALRRGEAPIVEVVSDASNRRAQAGAGRIERLLRGFAREHTALTLALRGVSIEVLDGSLGGQAWADAHGDSLVEAALAHGATDWSWVRLRWGVVLELSFPDETAWELFRLHPAVQAAFDAVPDPISGLIIYRGHGGASGAGRPRRPRPVAGAGAVALPLPDVFDEVVGDLVADVTRRHLVLR